MIRSMTGFGQAKRTFNDYHLQVDIKSVNHRYQETQIRMPRSLLQLEGLTKKKIQRSINRGRVDVYITMEQDANSIINYQLNVPLVEGYLEAAKQLNKQFGLEQNLTTKDILMISEVVHFQEMNMENVEFLTSNFEECVQEALDHLVLMRETEGRFLQSDISSRLNTLETQHQDIVLIAPQVNREYQEKLRRRIQELITEQHNFDENRFAMEVAMLAERANIDEELTRLASHFKQCVQLLEVEEPIGRKIDFLIQEMNREVNTIGSKANHSNLTNIVVDMKAELEKIREQVQNVE